jgi:hypothetical protein
LLGLLGLLGLSACATPTETHPFRTATEQLLVTQAAEAAAKRLVVPMKPGERVFLDTVNFSGEGSAYAASAIRESLVRQGAVLANDRNNSDLVVEVRLGALSIDQMNRLLGMPSLTLPISTSLTTATIPELSLYSRRDRTGVAEFAAFAYETRTGRLVGTPVHFAGETRLRSHKLMMVLSWGEQEMRPEPQGGASSSPWWKVW